MQVDVLDAEGLLVGDDVFHERLLLEVKIVHVHLLLLEQQHGHHTHRVAPHCRKSYAICIYSQGRHQGLALHLPHDFQYTGHHLGCPCHGVLGVRPAEGVEGCSHRSQVARPLALGLQGPGELTTVLVILLGIGPQSWRTGMEKKRETGGRFVLG